MLFFFASFALISCEDIQTNSPAMQAELEGELYRATDARAEILTDGTLILQGITDVENLTITLSSSEEGTYNLGENSPNRAVFQDFLNSVYTTRPFGDGRVIIEDVSENSFSGTFKFNAFRFGLDTLNAQKGVFFKVPLIAGSTSDEPDPVNNILTATINGTPFSANQITATETQNFILIAGTNQNETINLSFPNNITTDNNPIGGNINATYVLDGTSFEAVSGNISIVNHDTVLNEISGAFSFESEGPDGVAVTQGQFNVSY